MKIRATYKDLQKVVNNSGNVELTMKIMNSTCGLSEIDYTWSQIKEIADIIGEDRMNEIF
jgi:DNA-binding ferritin-like protein (Dps family)